MALTKIADSISTVEDVTGKDARCIGATIFVNGSISDEETAELQDRLNPKNIKETELVGPKRTAISL